MQVLCTAVLRLELIEAVRSAEIYQAYDPESFRMFVQLGPNGFEEIDNRMRLLRMRE